MPSNDDNYGQQWREFPPISDRLSVKTNTDPTDKHPSAFDKKAPSLKSGMTGGMKYQQAKKVKRKGVSNRPTDDGSDLTDLAQDAGAPMDGADKHMAQMFLDGNEEAFDYFI